MINFIFYPNNIELPNHLNDLIKVFKDKEKQIDSLSIQMHSNEVLHQLIEPLQSMGYLIESSKKKQDKIQVPVLFGLNNKVIKKFEADAFNQEYKTVIEVESGRGVSNNQFLKDYFEACMMLNVEYCVIAVRNYYKSSNKKDFDYVKNFFDALYASNKIKTDLKGVLIIGY